MDRRDGDRRRRRMGGVAFLPSSIANLSAWWRADLGIVKDGSDRVSVWNDQSGIFHLSQTTGADQTLWVDGVIGGHPIVRGDGVSDYIRRTVSDFLIADTGGSLFVVSVQSGNARLFGTADEGTSNFVLVCDTLGTGGTPRISTTQGSGTQVNVRGSTDVNDSNPHYISYESDNSNYFIRVDGADESLTESVGGADDGDWFDAVLNRDNITLGAIETTASFETEQDIAEMFFYSGKVSVSDRTRIETYLSDRYGI